MNVIIHKSTQDRASGSPNETKPSVSARSTRTSSALSNGLSSFASRSAAEARWSLAFGGLLLYAFIEYSRLPEMYPVFKPLQLGKIAVALAGLGYLISPRLRASGPSDSKRLDLAVLVFVLGNFLSACFASQQDQVWSGFLDVLLWGIVYFLMTRILVSKWQVRVFLFLLFLLNLKLAQHTVREYFLDRSLGVSDMQIIMRGGAGQGASSFFGNVADLGLAMAVVWGIVWALLLGKAEKKKLARVFLIICFCVFFLAILFCGSRGAVVGAAAIALVALAESPKKLGAVFLALLFVLGVWFVLPGASKERFSSAWDWQNDPNSASRVMFWKAGLVMFEENPIFGVGPGNFSVVNPSHYVSHSLYIQVLAESGLVGTVPLAVILILFFRLNARTRKRALTSRSAGRRSFEYCMAFGLDLALVGYLTSGAFLSVLYYPHLWILLGLSVAVNRSLANKEPEEQAIEKPSRSFALATP
jgi:O-antigen ligase